jgi:hypothetical protein
MTKLIAPFCNFVNAPKKLKTIVTLHNLKQRKKSHELILIRPQTQHKEQEHKHSKCLTLPTPSIEKIVNLFGMIYILLDNSVLINGYQNGEISLQG